MLNLSYDQGRTRSKFRPSADLGVISNAGDNTFRESATIESERRVNEHLKSQKVKISELLNQARQMQMEQFQKAMSEVVVQSHQISNMPTIRITQREIPGHHHKKIAGSLDLGKLRSQKNQSQTTAD